MVSIARTARHNPSRCGCGLRYCGNQCANTGRDAHRRSQNVVDHQRRRGQQSRVISQVFRRNGVRAATPGIGLDRLPVAGIHNGQQNHDGHADGDDVRHARRAQRNQQGQRRLRPVGRRAQRIQAKNWNARDRPDVLGALLARGERPSKQSVENACGDTHVVFAAGECQAGKPAEGIVSRLRESTSSCATSAITGSGQSNSLGICDKRERGHAKEELPRPWIK